MADKAELRKKLKRLQLIVHNRGDEELPNVVSELRQAIEEIDPPAPVEPERSGRKGRTRQERAGWDRGDG